MVAEALLGFNQAVRTKDFTAFYGQLSDVWKKETTPERLRTTFQEFLDKDIDIGKDGLARCPQLPGIGGKIDFDRIERKRLAHLS